MRLRTNLNFDWFFLRGTYYSGYGGHTSVYQAIGGHILWSICFRKFGKCNAAQAAQKVKLCRTVVYFRTKVFTC
ncbi:hypothetical protein TcasGA2_TC031472 [Tribolium castaneum]|uniref:Uncharacterized protein n=1 Tax=Tribolium castaneum TaxID=7070 RepID=A0A139WLY3_TRICA|nr:hypothetical protein TcasGA2_TC031472 [Tribolium castaneum]